MLAASAAVRGLIRRGWGLCLAALGFAFLLLGLGKPLPWLWGFPDWWAMFAGVLAVVGLLIAQRRPKNPIGWLFLAAGVVSGFQAMAIQYAILAYVKGADGLAGHVVAAWASNWIWLVFTGFLPPLV